MENKLKNKNILIVLLVYFLVIFIAGFIAQHNQIKDLYRINDVLREDWVEINANKDEVYQLYQDTLNKCDWANYDETDVNKDGKTDSLDLLIVRNYLLEEE